MLPPRIVLHRKMHRDSLYISLPVKELWECLVDEFDSLHKVKRFRDFFHMKATFLFHLTIKVLNWVVIYTFILSFLPEHFQRYHFPSNRKFSSSSLSNFRAWSTRISCFHAVIRNVFARLPGQQTFVQILRLFRPLNLLNLWSKIRV